MSFKKTTACLALIFSLILGSANTVRAAAYGDVPESHWAYSSIEFVSGTGFMWGNASGNFEPQKLIDKFETARILALLAGYRQTGATPQEADYYNKCYETHKTFINLYVDKFSKWNPSANMEIAYLLERGILVKDDLNQFVIIIDGTEHLRALSREEVSVFLIRLLGLASEAERFGYAGVRFADDAGIKDVFKPYVYYLRNIGIIEGIDGNFKPKEGVTRASMAVLTEKAYGRLTQSPGGPSAQSVPAPTPAPAASPPPSAAEAVQGKIVKIYKIGTTRAVQAASDGWARNRIFSVTADAVIKIGGVNRAFSDLAEGMDFTGTLSSDGKLVLMNLKALTPTPTPAPSPSPSPSPTPAPVSTPAAGGGFIPGTYEATLVSVYISKTGSTVTVIDDRKLETVYPYLPPNINDLYALRIGDCLRLNVGSMGLEAFTVIFR